MQKIQKYLISDIYYYIHCSMVQGGEKDYDAEREWYSQFYAAWP